MRQPALTSQWKSCRGRGLRQRLTSRPSRRQGPDAIIPSAGWSLKGERGQHFFVSEVAVADYTWEGQRHIVLLDQDNPALEERTDPNFLYYHERETGNRWAIGRYPSSSQDYVLYYQPSNGPKVWTRFHRAHLSRNDDRSVIVVDAIVVIESPATVSIQTEPTCGY